MPTPDRHDGALMPWAASAAGAWPPAPAGPPAAWDMPPEPEAAPARAITPRVVWRALRRHWWKILLVWGLGSALAAGAAYKYVKPSYDSTAVLKVEPSGRSPIGQPSISPGEMDPFMKTQAQLITSSEVLRAALQVKAVAALPRIGGAADGEAELKRMVRVDIPPGTQLIYVSASSESAHEVETVVNTVVAQYLAAVKTWVDEETAQRLEQLRGLKKKYDSDVNKYREELKGLVEKTGAANPAADGAQRNLNRYNQYQAKLNVVELELLEAEAALRVLGVAAKRQPAEANRPARPTDAQIKQMVEGAFRDQPEAAALYAQVKKAKENLAHTERISRSYGDPAAMKYRRDVEALTGELNAMWASARPKIEAELRRRLDEGDDDARDDEMRQALLTAEMRVDKLRQEQSGIEERLAQIKVDTRDEGHESLLQQFYQSDLARAEDLLRQVTTNLEDLEFQAFGPARISLIQSARAPGGPSGGNRLRMMAAAPVGMLAAVLALFILVEVRGGRVADPDDLPARLGLGVLGVVPPLPSLEAPRGPRALRDQRRRLEEFVQSLDHLRVALCAAAPAGAGLGAAPGDVGRRCVLITSACGGEGKTTLAAQLAGRCANAGLTTLLVDADLRRPALGELLEVPEGPGLVDVLRGDAAPEAALVVIGAAGGFHLLPAGTRGTDPSRLLQGERLGQLIARLREAFDVVIIDAPPVLAVPDALVLGRWTDGAVLAVRHDSSRFPMVERAKARLGSVGVRLLGAVVNGVRPAEAAYGAYGYYHDAPAVAAGAEPGTDDV